MCVFVANRMMDSALHNEYVSAALRDWQDRTALGMLHKSCNRMQTPPPIWKQHMFESYWGQQAQVERESSSNEHLPYYPVHSYSQEQLGTLQAILSPLSLCVRQQLTQDLKHPSHGHRGCVLPQTPQDVIMNNCDMSGCKKPVVIRSKGTVKRLAAAGKVKRITKTTPEPFSLHPVFQDHFSTLHSEHVPRRFLDSNSGIGARATPLRVRIPVSVYHHHLQGRTVDLEHSYYGSRKGRMSAMPISIASSCSCKTAALLMCPGCHRLYHPTCGREITCGRCPACSR